MGPMSSGPGDDRVRRWAIALSLLISLALLAVKFQAYRLTGPYRERDVAQYSAPGALHVQQHGQPVHLEQRTVHRCVRWACSKSRSPSTLTAITTTTMHAQATRAGSG